MSTDMKSMLKTYEFDPGEIANVVSSMTFGVQENRQLFLQLLSEQASFLIGNKTVGLSGEKALEKLDEILLAAECLLQLTMKNILSSELMKWVWRQEPFG